MKVALQESPVHGRGVFAIAGIQKDEIIETCPIIVLNGEETNAIDKTVLYDYYFGWKECGSAIALGYGSLYNHSYAPNAHYEKDAINNLIVFKALRSIQEGEEITINYNGDPVDRKPVWFEQRGKD